MTTNELTRRPPVMAMGSLEDPAELGRVLASSGYFSDVREAAQAVVKVLAGAELGFGPIASMTGVYIVKGRVTLSANLMAAAIKRHPRYDYRIAEHTDERAAVKFFERRSDGADWEHVGTSEFEMAHAQRAGLAGGENWRKYPGNMLLWRAMSNGAKFFCPDAFSGAPVYTPDELGADVDGATGDLIGDVPDVVQPDAPVTAPTTPPSVPPSPADVAPAEEPADRPGGVPENAAPPAPATAGPGPTIGGEDAEAVRKAATDEADPRADLARLLDRLRTDDNATQLDAMVRMALISYNAASTDDLTDVQAREVMGRALQRFGAKDGAA